MKSMVCASAGVLTGVTFTAQEKRNFFSDAPVGALSERGEVKSDRSPWGKYRASCRAFSPSYFLRPSRPDLSSLSLPTCSRPPPPRPPLLPSDTTFSLFLSFSLYLSTASFFAAFHEAQHLPAVTKKSSNHPRRSLGSLSFALLLLG